MGAAIQLKPSPGPLLLALACVKRKISFSMLLCFLKSSQLLDWKLFHLLSLLDERQEEGNPENPLSPMLPAYLFAHAEPLVQTFTGPPVSSPCLPRALAVLLSHEGARHCELARIPCLSCSNTPVVFPLLPSLPCRSTSDSRIRHQMTSLTQDRDLTPGERK